jgi:hypothetical protein
LKISEISTENVVVAQLQKKSVDQRALQKGRLCTHEMAFQPKAPRTRRTAHSSEPDRSPRLQICKVCKSCRSRKMLKNEYLLAKIGVDTADNELSKV